MWFFKAPRLADDLRGMASKSGSLARATKKKSKAKEAEAILRLCRRRLKKSKHVTARKKRKALERCVAVETKKRKTHPKNPAPPLAPAVQPPPSRDTPAAQPPPVDVRLPAPGHPIDEPPPQPAPPASPLTSPIATYSGPFGREQAIRLLYRAGFGPRPGDAEALVGLGFEDAILSLTRPFGAAQLVGPAPTTKTGEPWDIQPADVYEMDALYWFDRMLRSNQPLVERMALVLHDWFATNENGIPQLFMLNQTNLFRKYAFGSFKDLVHDIGADSAMILWLNLNKSVVNVANENYARELMELFTLGADRGAYTEQDIREASRALTGWTSQGNQETGSLTGFKMIDSKHDHGQKTIFGQTGNWGWEDVARLVIENPKHPSFFVKKLWSYFIVTPPTDDEVDKLAALYVDSGHGIRPVLEAILAHPALYTGPKMVKPPAVYVVGLLRARKKFINGELWSANAGLAGQRLYQPPDVGGWDDSNWLDSNTIFARWQTVYTLIAAHKIDSATYPATETPEQAVEAALAFWNHPLISEETRRILLDCATAAVASASDSLTRAQRQNALRQLVAISPDFQVC
jgi:hypothetical protein